MKKYKKVEKKKRKNILKTRKKNYLLWFCVVFFILQSQKTVLPICQKDNFVDSQNNNLLQSENHPIEISIPNLSLNIPE